MAMFGHSTSGELPSSYRERHRKWRLYYAFLALAILYIFLTGLVATLKRNVSASERAEEEVWISSSHYWMDRQLCRWIGCCGTFHMLNHAGWTWSESKPDTPTRDFSHFWHSATEDPDHWSASEREMRTIPAYVLEHAPYVHLFSGETYWPSDIAEHLVHTTPSFNHSTIEELDATRNLTNLNDLNELELGGNGKHVYLHSNDNIEELPAWLRTDHSFPTHMGRSPSFQSPAHNQASNESAEGRCGGAEGSSCQVSGGTECCSIFGWCGGSHDHCGPDCDPTFGNCYGPHLPGSYGPRTDLKKRLSYEVGGRSSAPAILIVVPKADGVVDAFWFFFYSYNQGKKVLDIRFGNHVGDWEHTMIRFQHGKPVSAFLSAHSWGASFTFDALEKYSFESSDDGRPLSSISNASVIAAARYKRPVVFSAEGSHAMYATPDYHDYVAPFGLLHDDTDRGPLWDPTKNLKSFTYDVEADMLRSSLLNPDAPTGWFDYAGHWGDRSYLLADPRQYRFAGEYHYVSGPLGPKFKNLGRHNPCIRQGGCKISTSIERGDGYGMIHM